MSSSSVRPLSNAIRPFEPGNAAWAGPAGMMISVVATAATAAATRARRERILLLCIECSSPLSGRGVLRFGRRLRWCHGAAHECQDLLLATPQRRPRGVLAHHGPQHSGLGDRA